MHPLTKEALIRFEREQIPVSPEDAISLELLAQKTDNCHDIRLLKHCGKKVGNVTIYPLTIGANTWLNNEAIEWFGYDEAMYGLAFVYAVCHSYDSDKFNFKSLKDAKKQIIKFCRNISATNNEIEEAILKDKEVEIISDSDQILRDLVNNIKSTPNRINLSPAINHLNNMKGNNRSISDKGTTPILSFLISNTSQDVEYWLWQKSWKDISRIIHFINKQNSDEEKVDPNDPSIAAFRAFHSKVSEIRRGKDLIDNPNDLGD